jgi:uncharacterized membrane protein
MIPHPLHAAIIHFPIVFILVGVTFSIVGCFTDKWAVRLYAAIFLGLAAAGAQAAYFSGEAAAGQMSEVTTEIQRLVSEHHEAAETAKLLALLAFLPSVVALFVKHKSAKVAAGLRIAAACLAVVATAIIVYTASLGGKLSQDHNYGAHAFDPPPAASELQPLVLED